MNNNIIDLPRIRTALTELDRIAAEHPELCGAGAAWTESEVEDMVRRKPGEGIPHKERQRAWRQRLAAKGYKREVFTVSPDGQTALMALREAMADKTRDQILEVVLISAADALTHHPEANP